MIAQDDKITPALIAVVGAIVIQAVVVPWVGRRVRRREKWEEDVSDLDSAVSEELPSVAARLRKTADDLRFWMLLEGDEKFKADAVAKEIADARSEHAEAAQAARALMKKIKKFALRVRRMRRKAPFWLSLRTRQVWVELAITTNSVTYEWQSREQIPDDEEWRKREIRFNKDIDEFVKIVSGLENRMVPPPRGLWRRVKESIARNWRKTFSRLHGPGAKVVSGLTWIRSKLTGSRTSVPRGSEKPDRTRPAADET